MHLFCFLQILYKGNAFLKKNQGHFSDEPAIQCSFAAFSDDFSFLFASIADFGA